MPCRLVHFPIIQSNQWLVACIVFEFLFVPIYYKLQEVLLNWVAEKQDLLSSFLLFGNGIIFVIIYSYGKPLLELDLVELKVIMRVFLQREETLKEIRTLKLPCLKRPMASRRKCLRLPQLRNGKAR